MNRQQKRATIRQVQKDIHKAKTGQLTAVQAVQMQERIKRLQDVGLLAKRPKIQRVKDFLRGLGRKTVGFQRAG